MTQDRRLTVVAALRDSGDSRRQRLLSYLAKTLDVVCVPVELPLPARTLNLVRNFSPRRALWRDRGKRNAYYFREASKSLAASIQKSTGGVYDLIILFEALYGPGVGSAVCKPYVVYEDSTSALALQVWPQWVPDVARTSAYRSLETEYYRRAARLVTSNERTRKSLIADYDIAPDKVVTIGQGCDLQPPAETRRTPGLIVFVGYDFERKGGRVLLEAFRKVRRSRPTAKLLLIGPEHCIEEPGVEITGPIRDRARVSELYGRANAFALPALYDPMPHAAMEAMSLGVPVVVSEDCGTSEIIEDGRSGFVVPSGDAELLADRLGRLIDDQALALRVGRAGAQTLKTHYTWEHVSNRVHHIALEITQTAQR